MYFLACLIVSCISGSFFSLLVFSCSFLHVLRVCEAGKLGSMGLMWTLSTELRTPQDADSGDDLGSPGNREGFEETPRRQHDVLVHFLVLSYISRISYISGSFFSFLEFLVVSCMFLESVRLGSSGLWG